MDTFFLFLLVGVLAQAVDGALGMAYGVISSSVLLALGVPPATASASGHAAGVFTTAASAGSHAWHKNVEWGLRAPLAIAGVIGGV
ncbi:MAG: sulfite exporter TauE/SafE family protein, partial [Brevundimonas diminuta]|nr:sulfite exporter TauE/SafE family protein [Brevundimonas diminuta]